MTDFGHLRKLEVDRESTYRHVFYQIDGEPWIECAPATDANKPYLNALLERSTTIAQRVRSGAPLSAQMLEDSREIDRELFPLFVTRAWGKIKDSSGADVPYSREAVTEFLQQLPNWLFDEFRNQCTRPPNFLGNLDPADVDASAGN